MRRAACIALLALTPFLVAQAKKPGLDLRRLFYGEVKAAAGQKVTFDYAFADDVELLDWDVVGEEPRVSKGHMKAGKEVSLIHRFPFTGDMTIHLAAKRIRNVSLEVAGNGESEGTGYQVRLETGRPGRVVVTRAGDAWLEEELVGGSPREAVFSLTGGVVTLVLDGKEVLNRVDPSPLTGSRVLLGGGAKGFEIDHISLGGGVDPMVVAAASRRTRLPKDRWIPILGERGLDDFAVGGGGWTVEEGALVFRGEGKKNGWAFQKEIDPTGVTSYVFELQLRTDCRQWTRRREQGYVFVSFPMGERNPAWTFHNIASEIRGVGTSRSQVSIALGRWHQVRVVVKGEVAEGSIDGKKCWTIRASDPIPVNPKQKRFGFFFGGARGPTYFKDIRFRITE